jgi:FKBP-type peptidyl-prolyl cis-trans isomerase FkpA
MKLNASLIALFVFILAMSACKKNETKNTTIGNFPMTVFKKGTGVALKGGEVPQFHVSVFYDDSLVNSSRTEANPYNVRLPDTSEIAILKKNNRVPAVIAALLQSHVGDSFMVVHPIDTLKNKPPGLEKVKSVVYHVSVLKSNTADGYKKENEARDASVSAIVKKSLEDYKSGALDATMKSSAKGVKVHIIEEGKGPIPEVGDMLIIDYYGALISDGSKFDSSFDRGEPFFVPKGQGQVIPGWEDAFSMLREGTKAVVFIPYAQAYGDQSPGPQIPAKSDLMFYMDFKKIKGEVSQPKKK